MNASRPEDFGKVAVQRKGRGLMPRSPELRLHEPEANGKIRGEEGPPCFALSDLDQQASCHSPFEQLAGASYAQIQECGHTLR